MYKRPPKHIQRTRLVILYAIMTLAVISIVGVLVLVVANYGYNQKTGVFEQRGLIQFGSTPSGATVEVDAMTLSAKTATKTALASGDYRFAVWREGYETWILNTHIPEGSLVWLNYIRLVPKNRPAETLQVYDNFVDAKPAPTNRSIMVQPDATKPVFRLVDISKSTPEGKELRLPEQTITRTKDETKQKTTITYELDSWDESGRFMTVWRVAGKSRELLVLDTTNAGKSVNVSRTFDLSITGAKFSGRSGKSLYVKVDDDVRKLDIAEGTVTRSLASDVQWYDVQDDNDTVVYTSQPHDDTGSREIGVYQDGDESPTVLRTVVGEKTKLSIASFRYYGTTYTAISEGKKFDLYKGHYDHGISGLQLVASRTLSHEIDSVEFNSTGSQILVRADDMFANYDIDRKMFTSNTLTSGSARNLFWIDSTHLGLIADGALTMRDIDGTNVFSLADTGSATAQSVLSRNGTYMYLYKTATTNKNETTSFQRIRMILR